MPGEPTQPEGLAPDPQETGGEASAEATSARPPVGDHAASRMQPPPGRESGNVSDPWTDIGLSAAEAQSCQAAGFTTEHLAAMLAKSFGTNVHVPDALWNEVLATFHEIPPELYSKVNATIARRLRERQSPRSGSSEVQPQSIPQGFDGLSDDDQSELAEAGITPAFYDEMKELTQELIRTGELSDDKRRRLNDLFHSLDQAPAAVGDKIRNVLSRENLALRARLDAENPAEALGEVPSDVRDSLGEVQGAVNRALAGEHLDIDEAQHVAEKLQEAREHLDKHEAEHIGRGPSKTYRLLVTLGVLFYLYIGAQYAMANAVSTFK